VASAGRTVTVVEVTSPRLKSGPDGSDRGRDGQNTAGDRHRFVVSIEREQREIEPDAKHGSRDEAAAGTLCCSSLERHGSV
jgi:hypothetical protein